MQQVPDLLCGPFVRRVEKNRIVLWFVTSKSQIFDLNLCFEQQNLDFESQHQVIAIGKHCFVRLLQASSEQGFPTDVAVNYSIVSADSESDNGLDLTDLGIGKLGQPTILVPNRLTNVWQGSCRKPHHFTEDALSRSYKELAAGKLSRPDYLLMSGDQLYADDIAGPMLVASQILSKKLGLHTATHELGTISPQQQDWRFSIYKRSELMPKKQGQSAIQQWWHGDNIISSLYHDNHLIGLDEFFACYLLTWSHKCWDLVMEEVIAAADQIPKQHQETYANELAVMTRFVEQLPDFEMLLANIPSTMIFDDHDVTDDWNLTADWEKHVYGNKVTKHIIRDALLSYALFQGWGNDPDRIAPLIEEISQLSKQQDFASHKLSTQLFDFNQWHFSIPTTPKIVVIDTRTHRWRSEISTKNPSGLMDWERLEQLEAELFEPQNSVLVVSAAPVFGVKAIEVVQKGCEIIGKELLVDVENWMAHEGAAKKLMNMLRHDKAPDEVLLLSGDVHYSFCFSAQRRFSSDTDKIWQLTCSGFKNEFPQGLIKFFDRIDRFLYSKHSPLNIFTKRRKLAIHHHPLELDQKRKRHLHSQSAVGQVLLTDEGYLQDYNLLTSSGEVLSFDIERKR